MSLSKGASVQDTMRAINDTCRSRGGPYAQYSCQTVSWDDVQRGTVGGGLSCWGSNITDTRLYAKNGTQLFTVRPDNWNEKLGRISTSDVALLVGNEEPGSSELKPITLRTYLKKVGHHGSYAGLKGGEDLNDELLDKEVSIRFQTSFLPVDDDGSAREALEFAPEAYSYQTRDDEDPRNLVLLCTTQGTALQQDGRGAKKLYHHSVDESGKTHRYWLEAEASRHKVGGAQKETKEEKEDALARGKATASVIGVKAMGTRFNVLMTIQVPLQQKPKPKPVRATKLKKAKASASGFFSGFSLGGIGSFGGMTTSAPQIEECCASFDGAECWGEDDVYGSLEYEMFKPQALSSLGAAMPPQAYTGAMMMDCAAAPPCGPVVYRSGMALRNEAKPKGRANAARVSRGSEVDVWPGLSVKEPKRNADEHVTVTVVIYNTVVGGVPSEEDVAAAVEDMEALYRQCAWSGELADDGAKFMKDELTVKDAMAISSKIATQPYTPPVQIVTNADVFPMSDDDVEEEQPCSLPVHSNVVCDVTNQTITGVRYHRKGEDFDLCEAEFKKLSQTEKVMFELISQPGATPVDIAAIMA